MAMNNRTENRRKSTKNFFTAMHVNRLISKQESMLSLLILARSASRKKTNKLITTRSVWEQLCAVAYPVSGGSADYSARRQPSWGFDSVRVFFCFVLFLVVSRADAQASRRARNRDGRWSYLFGHSPQRQTNIPANVDYRLFKCLVYYSKR